MKLLEDIGTEKDINFIQEIEYRRKILKEIGIENG